MWGIDARNVSAPWIMPYISASTCSSSAARYFPTIDKLQRKKKGERRSPSGPGTFTVVLSLFQGYGFANLHRVLQGAGGEPGVELRILTAMIPDHRWRVRHVAR